MYVFSLIIIFSSNNNYFINTDIQWATVKMKIFSMILLYLRNDIFTVISHIKYEISDFHCWRTSTIAT